MTMAEFPMWLTAGFLLISIAWCMIDLWRVT
jgi:hypothetical protein